MAIHSSATARPAPSGFLATWAEVVGPRGVPSPAPRRGRKPRVPVAHLLPALTWHVMQDSGTVADHLFQLFREPLADSSWSDRRLRLPWAIFAELMRRALRPRATARRHRDAFWRGWRLVALDGTQFSLINTPQITTTVPKARTRRGRAAFAKMTTAVLLDVGLHNPLAAAIGRRGQSEWALACPLLAQLPNGALLLADRYYGVAAFARAALAACQRVGSHFVVRVRVDLQARRIARLRDGSVLVDVPVRAHRSSRIVEWLRLREVRVRVGRAGHRPHEFRLWTSLLDPAAAPAEQLARVYASRWEHEWYFRELKRQVRRSAVLQSHTPETAAQEIAALILASAVLASERARAATPTIPARRISFSHLLNLVRGMWLVLGSFDARYDAERNRARARHMRSRPTTSHRAGSQSGAGVSADTSPVARQNIQTHNGSKSGWPDRHVTRNAKSPPTKPSLSADPGGSPFERTAIRIGTSVTLANASAPTRPYSASTCTKLLWLFSPSIDAGKRATVSSEISARDSAGNCPGPTPKSGWLLAMRSPTRDNARRIRKASANDGRTVENRTTDTATTTAAIDAPSASTRNDTIRLRTPASRTPPHADATAAREPLHQSATESDRHTPNRAHPRTYAIHSAGTTMSA